MGQLELHHGRDGRQAGGDILGGLGHLSPISAVGSTQVVPSFLDGVGEASHHVQVRVKLDLPRTVKQDERIVGKLRELLHQPVNILDEMLHTVDEAAIRPPVLHLLHVVKRDQVSDVYKH